MLYRQNESGMGNVLSWGKALIEGFTPRLYGYTPEEVPIGECEAVLNGKIWAKKVMGINCYFSQVGTGNKFLVTIYCRKNGTYMAEGSEVDFSICPINRNYLLRIALNGRGRVKLESAILLAAFQKEQLK